MQFRGLVITVTILHIVCVFYFLEIKYVTIMCAFCYWTGPNCCTPCRLFSYTGSCEHKHRCQKANRHYSLLFKCYLFLVAISAFWSSFIACLTERELLTSDFSIRNCRQRVTSQHTANAKELCTRALPRSRRFRICKFCGGDCKGAEFIGNNNEQVHSLIYRYSALSY